MKKDDKPMKQAPLSISAITRMCRDRMDKQRTFDIHLMSRMNRFVDRVTHLHDSQLTMKKEFRRSFERLPDITERTVNTRTRLTDILDRPDIRPLKKITDENWFTFKYKF